MENPPTLDDHTTFRPRNETVNDAPAPPEIPDYRFVKAIGSGAFGTVWLAEETLAGVFRAIKVLHRGESRAADTQRIERELAGIHAYQAQTNDHPHLVRILKTGRCEIRMPAATASSSAGDAASTGPAAGVESRQMRRTVYYVMEIADYARGARPHGPDDYEPLNLATLVRQQGRLDARRIAEHAACLLDAIEHLRKAGLQHRDIKPANVIFIDGVIKLADLGLTSSDQDDPAGTPGFLPPEGKADDLYALGKVIYAMTTGERVADFPEWPADLDPEQDRLLSPLRDLINRMCHPAAEQRLSDPREIRRLLERMQAPDQGPLRVSRRRALISISSAFAGGVLGGGFTTGMVERSKLAAERRAADPTSWKFSTREFDGSVQNQDYDEDGWHYSLFRIHDPNGDQRIEISQAYVRFADLETRLSGAHFEVCGAFQIYDVGNPIQGGITDDRGQIDEIYLVVGDEHQPELSRQLKLLYHGQPGSDPGVRSRFGARGAHGIPLSVIRANPNLTTQNIYLAYRASSSPEEALVAFKRNGLRDFPNPLQIARVHYIEKRATDPVS